MKLQTYDLSLYLDHASAVDWDQGKPVAWKHTLNVIVKDITQ